MLDHRFVEWALSLPRAMKIANGQSKFALKRAFERLVPHQILHRPKQGFSVPLASWFRGALGENFRREVSGEAGLMSVGYFDGKVIESLTDQHQRGLRDHSRVLWLLWMFQNFMKGVHGGASATRLSQLPEIGDTRKIGLF
jgi:asparagine synthase (glutamine-hydrolysing)